MSAAETDQADARRDHRVDETVGDTFDPAIGSVPRFAIVISVIRRHRRSGVKPRKFGQGQTMLGDIGHVLRRTKFNVHV